MSEQMPKQFSVGTIVSTDLTTENAEHVRDFYEQVIGWEPEELPMEDQEGKYADYVMKDAAGNWMGGVCHRRGMNADMPAGWMVYINVTDIATSVERCVALGGKVIKQVQGEDGTPYYAVIQDPAGAILGLTKTG